MPTEDLLVIELGELRRTDVDRVGGKNASLGEMIANLQAQGVRVPGGFATTAHAYWHYVDANNLRDAIAETMAKLKDDHSNLARVGRAVRELLENAEVPPALAEAVRRAYAAMAEGGEPVSVAVRSSATAEDLPEASFAGQLESYLNVQGEAALLRALRRCYASLFTDRAIAYRVNNRFDHLKVALSVGIQRMVRSDKAGSGVMFSIDTETGFPRNVLIDAAWGLGELVVQGIVDPDEYTVFKPLLEDTALRPIIEKRLGAKDRKMVFTTGKEAVRTVSTARAEQHRFVLEDDDILELARWAVRIERHYGRPMDIEWAKDGLTGELFVVQARPETVQSRRAAGMLKAYHLTGQGEPLVKGLSIGASIGSGPVCKLANPTEIDRFVEGGVLVTGMTDPDWVPIMKKAAAIVTDHGGRTSHAAIVSRELGLTAVVGAGDATAKLADGQEVTVSCAEGDTGFVYAGLLDFEVEEIAIDSIPATTTKVMLNLADPAGAFTWWRLPTDGVGLARMEFIVENLIRIHPMALVKFDELTDEDARRQIDELTIGYASKPEFFVDRLARGIARIAAAHHPAPVIVRMSDFKTNEYAELIGGRAFEPKEENPMLGWRGASRYYSDGYREGFALECRAIRRAREELGFTNIVMMIPFVRTVGEADAVLAEMAEHGLMRGRAGLEVFMMCEIPANIILAEKFAERFDGFSIGSNDLTQLTLGVDRDSSILSSLFDERDPAVEASIATLLAKARAAGTKTGICGQAPSDHPEFAAFLVEHGIDSISVSPDSFMAVKRIVAEAEASRQKSATAK
ncbi:MAG TPA: phosphoenolpyruvate synthase [Geminicoccaceae bacterium]|jgi:pyruvate,water dikinase|nr:phosphoenolpyruvate synthase [Geminicoccaceae bacterium]